MTLPWCIPATPLSRLFERLLFVSLRHYNYHAMASKKTISRLLREYAALRYEILERDNFTCQKCGRSAPSVKLEVHHIIPIEEGGTDDPSNLITLCWACHHGHTALRVRRRLEKVVSSPADLETPTRPPTLKSQILTTLQKQGPISVRQLTVQLKHSFDSIRRTLYRLQDEGKAKRLDDGRWIAVEPSHEHRRTRLSLRERILFLLSSAGKLRPRELAMQLDRSIETVRRTLYRMKEKGQVEKDADGYWYIPRQ